MEQRIIIRHAGEGEPKVQEISAESFTEAMIGREPGCRIQYDEDRDEIVSRHHAKLIPASRAPLIVAIVDLDSRNGTFVNGHRVKGELRLSPGDRIRLGPGGPEFDIDIQPPNPGKETVALKHAGLTVAAPTIDRGDARPVPPAIPVPPRPRSSSGLRLLVLFSGLVLMIAGLALVAAWMAVWRGGGKLSVRAYHQKTVMTVAYKAYGNPEAAGGKYWFSKVVLQNVGTAPLRDVRVSYQVPDYISWTTPDEAPEILPGATTVFPFYPKFPAKVTSLRTRTPAQLEIKIDFDDGSGRQTRTEKREFEFRGLTEFEYTSLPANEVIGWYDRHDNDPLLASFIQDEDPAVKTFFAKISEVSGGINIISDAKTLVQFEKSVYDYMVSLGMTYSGAKGVDEKNGDIYATIQSIRLPRDLIYGNSGLCIELALLWCSLAQAAGAKGYLVMIPGHAFPIIEANDGSRLPIEATAIGGGSGGNMSAAASFEAAANYAVKELKEAQARGIIEILDVGELQNKGIRPPELPDINRPELVRMLEERRARHGRGSGAKSQAPRRRGGIAGAPGQYAFWKFTPGSGEAP